MVDGIDVSETQTQSLGIYNKAINKHVFKP